MKTSTRRRSDAPNVSFTYTSVLAVTATVCGVAVAGAPFTQIHSGQEPVKPGNT